MLATLKVVFANLVIVLSLLSAIANSQLSAQQPAADLELKYHLMHPGGPSLPGDPNAAFHIDGAYHLHYIVQHPWKDRRSFSFVHVTGHDMLNWVWQPTKLQPAFTGHGMFSGTGFITKDGKPAVIYHGEGSGKNQIAIANDNTLTRWQKPYPIEIENADGTAANIHHWDPDCFQIDGTYYAISGGENPPLMKSSDLKKWQLVGPFLKQDMPDVIKGEDISCANFFPLGDKWMLLCISHDIGCRYYIGDWDSDAEQFAPLRHGRLNWRRESQSLFSREAWRVDFFAPESVLTPDGRRVMWAWLATIDRNDGTMSELTMQALPRELSLSDQHELRIKPIRELESLRFDHQSLGSTQITEVSRTIPSTISPKTNKLTELRGDAMEIQIELPRDQALRKLFGFVLFDDGASGGLPLIFRPDTKSIRLGTAEAPFDVESLDLDEPLTVRIFIDRHLVEVFVNDRQAMAAHYREYAGRNSVGMFSVGGTTEISAIDTWQLNATNHGFKEAQAMRVWEPTTE